MASQQHDKDFYIKKVNSRKLGGSIEFTTIRLAKQVNFVVSILFLLNCYDLFEKKFSLLSAIGFCVMFAEYLVTAFVSSKIVKDVTGEDNSLSSSTRKLGYLLIPFMFLGNILMTISGFMIVKKGKTIEYQLSIYSFISTFSIIAVSCINLFKPYVSDTFFLGMGLYGAYTLINLATIVMAGKYTSAKKPDKKFLAFAVLGILGIALGNLFSFLMGIIAIRKYTNKNEDINIEWIDVVKRLFKNYMSVIGMLVVTFLISVSIASTLTFDYSIAIDNNYSALLLPPCLEYPFGTDEFGRCVFTRIVFGARISLLVGLVATIIPIIIGGLLGAVAGYYGGKKDNVIMRVLDVLYAVPGILLAIAIIAAFGANTLNLIIALSIGNIPSYARTVRATVMGISGQEFVEAAKACGAKNGTIILKHIIPNSLAPVIVRATMGIGGAVLSTSSLSFLGIGVEPHIPEWGNILKAGSAYLETNPYIAIFPGLAIITIVLAFNYFGDGLRDSLDPKLK